MLHPSDRSGGRADFCIIMPFHMSEGRGGGAEIQAWFLARELARRRFRTAYVAQSIHGKQGAVETVDGVSIHWVRYAHRFRWSNALAYYQALSRVDAEIVIQRMTAFTTGVAAYWCWRHQRNFVWMCSDNAAPQKWFFWRAQREANRSSRVGWTKAMILLLDALITDLGRNWGMKHVWMAFTQNDAQKKLLDREFGLDSERMISGHPVPDRMLPDRERRSWPIVLWAAHLGARKCPEKFIELARLAENTALDFVMVGGHADPSRIAELFAQPPRNLKWLGKVSFDEALALFDRADFFVNTSRVEAEGFPNTFIQAWLRGVPVLSLMVDPDGVIERNRLGFVCNQLQELLARIIELTENKNRYAELRNRVTEYARARLSVEVMVDHFLEKIGSKRKPEPQWPHYAN